MKKEDLLISESESEEENEGEPQDAELIQDLVKQNFLNMLVSRIGHFICF